MTTFLLILILFAILAPVAIRFFAFILLFLLMAGVALTALFIIGDAIFTAVTGTTF